MAIHSVADWNGTPYFVMPYSRGVSLQRRLNDEGPLQLREILRIGMQVGKGLAAAHAQGIVHRDVKPANIFLETGVERVALMDFGLARALDDASLTHTGILAGTPQYMAPEQARADAIDARADLFSLGAVLYAMCTGHPPFRAETAYGVLRLITDRQPRPIQEVNADIPDWLSLVIARLMEKRPDDRFASADEAAKLLERCLAHVQDPTRYSLPTEISHPHGATPLRPISPKGVITMLAIAGSFVLAFVLLQSAEKAESGSEEAAEATSEHGDHAQQVRLPKGLIERLGPLRERMTIPKNASIEEFEDRYEITASPWHTTTLLVDGDVPSRAHKEHKEQNAEHEQVPNHEHATDHKHDTDHKDRKTHDANHLDGDSHESDHTHTLSHSEYFADEGTLSVTKSKKGDITFELIGHAGFESDLIHFSADRMKYHLGDSDARMILMGHARLVNDQIPVVLTADKITNQGQATLAEGHVRFRRKAPTGESEILSADRLEIDHASNTIKAD
jgi:serine/threonine protein kinase